MIEALQIVHDWNFVKMAANEWLHTDAADNFDDQRCWEVAAVVQPMTSWHVDRGNDEMVVKLHVFSSTKIVSLANNPELHLVKHYDFGPKNDCF